MRQATNFYERILELNSDISIREATIDDGPAFVGMMNNYFRRQKQISYFKWQFSISNTVSKLFVAYHDEKIVGCYGIQILKLNNRHFCGFTVDLLVDEDFRNRGLFVLLENEAARFARLQNAIGLISLANLDGKKAHTWIEDWKQVGIIKTLARDLTNIKQTDLKSSPLSEIIFFYKTQEYRHWRFDANPLYNYSYINIDSQTFAVVKIYHDSFTNESFGDIVDIQCDLNDIKAIQDVLLSSCDFLKKQRIEKITLWGLPHTSVGRVARAMGFKETSQERYFCVKVLQPGHEYLYDFSRWHLVEADSEIY